MAEPAGRDALGLALDQCADAGRPVPLWLRDDDATQDTPALRRLMSLASDHGLAPVIAAIPDGATGDLGPALCGDGARVAVHGIAHQNHAARGEKKCELGVERPADLVLAELDRARERLLGLMGERLIAMLVPPWNRIAPELIWRLGEAGFKALSAHGPRSDVAAPPGLRVINVDLDIIAWRTTRAGRPPDELFGELAAAVRGFLADDDSAPIGILTHHLVHDEVAWEFLEALLNLTARHPGALWMAGEALMATPAPATGSPGAPAPA